MKKLFIASLVAVTLLVGFSSCKKDSPVDLTHRKFRFQLYTTGNFSEDGAVIHFSLVIRNGNRTLFDSSLSTMQIKDIPDSSHKLIFEKTVLAPSNSNLAAGFDYAIDNVGNSWHIDTSKAGNPFKVIDYDFQ